MQFSRAFELSPSQSPEMTGFYSSETVDRGKCSQIPKHRESRREISSRFASRIIRYPLSAFLGERALLSPAALLRY